MTEESKETTETTEETRTEDLTNTEIAAQGDPAVDETPATEEEQKEEEAQTEEKPEEEAADGEDGEEEADEDGDEEKGAADTKAEEKPDNAAYARMRRAEKERDDLQAALAAKEAAAPKEEVAEDVEPDRDEDPEAHADWRHGQLQKENEDLRAQLNEHGDVINGIKEQKQYSAAEKQLSEIEGVFEKTNPDYQDAVTYMSTMMFRGMKLADPFKSDAEITEDIRNTGMNIAASAHQNGENAASALYEMAKNHYGYTPELMAEMRGGDEEASEPEKVIDIKKVAQAKKRSASGLNGGRSKSVQVTADSMAGMTNAEFAAQSEADKQRAMNG